MVPNSLLKQRQFFGLLYVQISKLETPTAKDMKHIDRKLKACRDPGSSDKYFSTNFIFIFHRNEEFKWTKKPKF